MRVPLFVVCVVSLTVAGCLARGAYHPVRYYDLRTRFSDPATEQASPQRAAPVAVVVDRFRMIGPHETRMVYRHGPRRIEQDEYHRWIQSPEDLIAREFRFALGDRFPRVIGARQSSALRLSGDVLVLEIGSDKTAILSLDLTLTNPDGDSVLLSKRYRRQTDLQGHTPDAYAGALAAALESVIGEAIEDIARTPGVRGRRP